MNAQQILRNDLPFASIIEQLKEILGNKEQAPALTALVPPSSVQLNCDHAITFLTSQCHTLLPDDDIMLFVGMPS